METKQIKIEVPQGYEIDKEKSTFENIILKPIDVKLPLSVDEIPNRFYFIGTYANLVKTECEPTKNQLSTENRAKAFLALMQLVELRDAWNGDWRADWKNNEIKYCIVKFKYETKIETYENYSEVLYFKTKDLAEKFLAQFEGLINEAKELL
jgi:hypothetical protein